MEKIRLDKYLTDTLSISRSKVQKLIKDGKVVVNGVKRSSNFLVNSDDEIEVGDMNYDIKIEKENIPLDIVYEDEYLLIVNKPSGMVVHPAAGNFSHTLVNALLYRYNFNTEKNIRPGIVHRIDKDTSGLMVVAKDDDTAEKLSDMIKNKLVKRAYKAVVYGPIKEDSGRIEAPIGRDALNRQKMAVTDINSKDAITNFKVLKRFKNYTYIECILDTGRTHQIRVHMAYIGHPIYNDPLYSGKKATIFGQFLHSYKIAFNHPVTGKYLEFECDLPEEFKYFLSEIEKEE